MSTRKEKLDRLKEIEAARNVKRDSVADAASEKRIDNELLLAEIESDKNLTLHIDMGVVWLTDGSMILVRKPSYLAYEKYQMELLESTKVTRPQIRDEFLKDCMIYPSMQAAQQLCDVNGDCLFEAANLASRMHDVSKAEGKS